MPDQKHINFALVEDVRPQMYTAMKYWGKKPHNIWAEFIETYCPQNGIVLDPFAGSAISAFETVRMKRKAFAFDLNPLSSFMIEVLSSELDETKLCGTIESIVQKIQNDQTYKRHYTKVVKGKMRMVYNYRWNAGKVVKVAIEGSGKKRSLLPADKGDARRAKEMSRMRIPHWFPTRKFPKELGVTHKFIRDVGGNSFQYLWTRRNLYILSKMFDRILKIRDSAVKFQLLSAFIQTIHLVSKMVVPRNPKSHREFSGSWGRADYMIRRRSMEQNPLMVFERSCYGKQGILNALKDSAKRLPRPLMISSINTKRKIAQRAAINYGILDIADLSRYVKPKSIDFIITDPPYAGLVPYLGLSLVWLVWLEKIDKKYYPDFASEITIRKGITGREEYRRRLNNAFRQMHGVLKDDGFIVITFHHKKILEWNDFVHAVKLSGFRFDKITHQYNRRSGESNVSNPYGTSGADFYIRCVKHRDIDFSNDTSGLEIFIFQKAVEIISLRNEPTPYSFLVSGLIPEMLQAGYMQPKEYQDEIQRILEAQAGPGKPFCVVPNTMTKAGDFWWFNNPAEYIAYPDLPLQDRVEHTVIGMLRRRVSVRLDDVLAELFRSFPNGLTPDPRSIRTVLEKYAYKSASSWKIKPATIQAATEHTKVIAGISDVGVKAGYRIHVGKREQPEVLSEGVLLRSKNTVESLSSLSSSYDDEEIGRIEMIDSIWLEGTNDIACIFEVENTTGFMSAIQRGSNINARIPKFMVIPDAREDELKGTTDPLFVESFVSHNWRYLTYSDVDRLIGYANVSLQELARTSKPLS